MTRRRKQKIGDGDELIFGVIDHLETDSEGRSPAKFASPKEKKELEKVQKNKKLPKVVETPEKKPEPMTTELLEPSTEDKKVIEVQQKVINKRINLNDDSESSESEDCKVKAIKPKSHMTGKQSTETVFKSVISGGSEMGSSSINL